MPYVRKILAATDFSAYSVRVEHRCASLCRQLSLDSLELLNVQKSGWSDMLEVASRRADANQRTALVREASNRLKMAAERIRACHEIQCNITVCAGEAVPEIVAFAESQAADMIAVGNSNRNRIEKLLGTTADKLMRMSRRPVLLVRTVPSRSYRRVVVPVDFSPESEYAARIAFELAPDAHIVFFHAFSVWAEGKMKLAGIDEETIKAYREKYGAQARSELNQFIERLDPNLRSVSRAVQFGLAVPTLLSYAEKVEPDLLVIGKHSGSRVEEFLMGSVTRRIINQTTCDVLVIPSLNPDGDWWYQRPAA